VNPDLILLDDETCRVCGCTHYEACVDDVGEPCYWIEPGLCSACAEGAVLL